MKHPLVLTFFATHTTRVQALVMVKSLRTLGGSLANTPIWMMMPAGQEISGLISDELRKLKVVFHTIPADPIIFEFPYASKPLAAAAAEALAEGVTENLVWIDRDGLITAQPNAFLLPEGKTLGYRPTDLRNIGAPWGAGLTPLWQEIYTRFEIPTEKTFKMNSVVDHASMHPYFNAGLLVVRPEHGLLRQWKTEFLKYYNNPIWKPYIQQNPVHHWLLHQVLLTGTLLKHVSNEAMLCLPEGYNYPINLHHQFQPGENVKTLDQITTGRIDQLLREAHWRIAFEPNDPILSWLDALLEEFGPYYEGDWTAC